MHDWLAPEDEGQFVYNRRPEVCVGHYKRRKLAANQSPPYRFAYARTALKYGLKAFGFECTDQVIVPEFVCESLLEPFDQLGISVAYYPVEETLEPAWTELEKLLTASTRAVVAVHYFGQPQRIPDFVDFCKAHSLMLIEDNAHGFGSTFDGRLIGTFGQIGITAPRKSFPIRNGAYLYLKQDKPADLSALDLQGSAWPPITQHLKQTITRLPVVDAVRKRRRELLSYRRSSAPRPPYGSQLAFRDQPILGDYGMDESSELFLSRQDMDHIRRRRRQVYELWRTWALTQELTPVFPDLADGAMPLVFPAYTKSAAESREWYDRGHRARVDVHSWPTLPQEVVARDGAAMRLWERLVCFPVHQEMNTHLLERRLSAL